MSEQVSTEEQWRSNIQALTKKNHDLAQKVVAHDKTMCYDKNGFLYRAITARRGGVSILMEARSGQNALHSTIDPHAEAKRICAMIKGEPRIIFVLTLGNGYLVEETAARFPEIDIVIVEYDVALIATALKSRDYCELLRQNRLHLLYVDALEALQANLHRYYLPTLHGKAEVAMHSAVTTHSADAEKIYDFLRQHINEAYSARALYAQLGRRWFHNICVNSRELCARQSGAQKNGRAHTTEQKKDIIAIAAAGPSLDEQIASLHENEQKYEQGGYALIATDSALPVLRPQGIAIEACVRLDCQLATYLHFIDAPEVSPPLYVDFAIHPWLMRISARGSQESPSLLTNAHPLAVIALQHLRKQKVMWQRASHVTESAFVLALRYAPKKIIIYGADYGYRAGKGYARGAYLSTFLQIHASYLEPLELRALTFTWRHAQEQSTARRDEKIIPRFFDSYKRELFSYAARHGYRARAEQEGIITFTKDREREMAAGAEMQDSSPLQHEHWDSDKREGNFSSSKESKDQRRQFLREYALCVAALPAPSAPYLVYIARLSQRELLTLLSLLPLVAHIKERAYRYGPHERARATSSSAAPSTSLPLMSAFQRAQEEVARKIDALLATAQNATGRPSTLRSHPPAAAERDREGH